MGGTSKKVYFTEAQKALYMFIVAEVCAYFGVPADMLPPTSNRTSYKVEQARAVVCYLLYAHGFDYNECAYIVGYTHRAPCWRLSKAALEKMKHPGYNETKAAINKLQPKITGYIEKANNE